MVKCGVSAFGRELAEELSGTGPDRVIPTWGRVGRENVAGKRFGFQGELGNHKKGKGQAGKSLEGFGPGRSGGAEGRVGLGPIGVNQLNLRRPKL